MTPGPVPVCAIDPGPERWAEAGAVIANAATIAIATPLKRVLISIVLCCRVSGAFGRSDREIAARLTRSADGVVGVVTVDTAPVLGIEICLPGREAGWLPLRKCGNCGERAEMPIGYHRDVCIASPTAAHTLPEPSPHSAQERSIVRRHRYSAAGRIFTCRSQASGTD